MIFVMDIGNTNIVLGVYEGKKLVAHWRMSTDKDKLPDELGMFFISLLQYEGIGIDSIEAVIIASVVPSIMYSLENAIRKYFNVDPVLISPGTKTGMNIKYENPREVGADRIVNAVAAIDIYGGPLIIVDFGTATTFCAINSKGEYLGGAICPGMEISVDALFQKASKLPRVELAMPKNIIGRNTVQSIQAGIIYGYVGQIDYIVKRMKKEINEDDIKVIATGGLAKLVATECETIDEINDNLTLEGLRIIYEKNK